MLTEGSYMSRIRHFLIPSVTLFFCSRFVFIALAQEKLPEIVKKIEPSTVVILTYGKDGKVRHPPQSGWLDERGCLKGSRPDS